MNKNYFEKKDRNLFCLVMQKRVNFFNTTCFEVRECRSKLFQPLIFQENSKSIDIRSRGQQHTQQDTDLKTLNSHTGQSYIQCHHN